MVYIGPRISSVAAADQFFAMHAYSCRLKLDLHENLIPMPLPTFTLAYAHKVERLLKHLVIAYLASLGDDAGSNILEKVH